jgi:hypothetical protein
MIRAEANPIPDEQPVIKIVRALIGHSGIRQGIGSGHVGQTT